MNQNDEFTKLFTTTVAFVRNEIDNLQEDLLERITTDQGHIKKSLLEEVSREIHRLEEKKEELQEMIRRDAIEVVSIIIRGELDEAIKTKIPDDLVRQAGFDFLERTVRTLVEKVNTEIDTLKKHEHQGLIESVQSLQDRSAALGQALEDEHTKLVEADQSFREVTGEIKKSVSDLSNVVNHNSKEIDKELKKLSDFLEKGKEKTQKLIDAIQKDFEKSLGSLKSELTKNIDVLSSGVAKRVQDVEHQTILFGKELDEKLEALVKETEEKLTQKASLEHIHEEFKGLATKDHTHREFGAFSLKDHDHKEFALLSKEIDRVSNESLKQKDLKRIAEEASKKVKISKPKDGEDGKPGKDAKNWEFKFHPKQRGLLLYKREDWPDWKSEDLLGPSSGVLRTNPNDLLGIGGGGAESAGFLHNGNTTTFTDLRMAVGQVYTDANGMFEFDTSRIPFRNIVSASASCPLLSDVMLSLEERTIDAYVDQIAGDVITGLAVRTKASVALLGTELQIRDCAGAGILVNITVIGY